MGIEVLVSILAGLLSMVLGGVASNEALQKFFRKILKLPEPQAIPYAARLSQLTAKLDEASSEVDEVLTEISAVTDQRQKRVEKLESDLSQLELKENQLKESITALESTPVEAAKHFAALVSEGEKRGAMRDYALFGAGVIVSTVVAIAIQMLLA